MVVNQKFSMHKEHWLELVIIIINDLLYSKCHDSNGTNMNAKTHLLYFFSTSCFVVAEFCVRTVFAYHRRMHKGNAKAYIHKDGRNFFFFALAFLFLLAIYLMQDGRLVIIMLCFSTNNIVPIFVLQFIQKKEAVGLISRN